MLDVDRPRERDVRPHALKVLYHPQCRHLSTVTPPAQLGSFPASDWLVVVRGMERTGRAAYQEHVHAGVTTLFERCA